MRRRGGRKRALGTRVPLAPPAVVNQHWSLEFVSGTLVGGRRFRMLCVVDEFSRECLALIANISLSGRREYNEVRPASPVAVAPQARLRNGGQP